jgi:hypothetical protein
MVNDIIPLFGVLGFFLTSGWMLKIFLGYRERMKVLERSKGVGAGSDERLVRVEQAVESIAIEIERVSEGQRFVTKLLNEKAQAIPQSQIGAVPVPVISRRVDTPH